MPASLYLQIKHKAEQLFAIILLSNNMPYSRPTVLRTRGEFHLRQIA